MGQSPERPRGRAGRAGEGRLRLLNLNKDVDACGGRWEMGDVDVKNKKESILARQTSDCSGMLLARICSTNMCVLARRSRSLSVSVASAVRSRQ